MKHLLLIIFILFPFILIAEDKLIISDKTIKAGETISIKFFSERQFEGLEIYVYEAKLNHEAIVKEVELRQQKSFWEIDIPTSTETQFLFMNVRCKGRIVYASKNDFILFDGEYESECLALIAKFGSKNYAHYLKIESNDKLSIVNFEKAFQKKPELKRKYFLDYLNCFDLDNELSKISFKKELNEFANYENLNSQELGALVVFYERLEMENAKDSAYSKWTKAYPDDLFVLNMEFFRNTIKDFVLSEGFNKKNEIYQKYLNDHKSISQENKKGLDLNIMNLLVISIEDYISEGKFIEWENEVKKLDSEVMLGTYFLASNALYRKNSNLDIAKNLCYTICFLKKNIILNRPRDWREPLILSEYDKVNFRKKRLATYYNLYGNILEKLNFIDSAKVVLREATFELSNLEYDDIVNNYLNFIGKHYDNSLFKKEELLIKLKKGEDSFALIEQEKIINILLNPEKETKEFDFQTIKVEIIKKNLPQLQLINEAGEKVDLNLLTTKIIVLDFWATWCGPCFLKFKPMQKLMNYYQNDKDIAFLYINTNERDGISEKVAIEKVRQKGYNFEILFDKKNNLAEELGIRNIPAVIILDQNKNIRFIEIGYKPIKGVNSIFTVVEQLKKY